MHKVCIYLPDFLCYGVSLFNELGPKEASDTIPVSWLQVGGSRILQTIWIHKGIPTFFHVGILTTFSNLDVLKLLFEATDEELKKSMKSSKGKVATAAKAKPTPKAKVASKAKAAEVVVPSGATTETPVKEGKRCSKADPESTPEVSTTRPPQVNKRQRGKQADPDPATQIKSLKEARLLDRSQCLAQR